MQALCRNYFDLQIISYLISGDMPAILPVLGGIAASTTILKFVKDLLPNPLNRGSKIQDINREPRSVKHFHTSTPKPRPSTVVQKNEECNDSWYCGWKNLNKIDIDIGEIDFEIGKKKRRRRRGVALKQLKRYKRSNVNTLFDENLPPLPEKFAKKLPRSIEDMGVSFEEDISKFGNLESKLDGLLNSTQQRILDGDFGNDNQSNLGRFKREDFFLADEIVNIHEIFNIDSLINSLSIVFMMAKLIRIGHPMAKPYYNDICKSKSFQERNITIINCEEILFQAVKRYEDEDIDDFIGTIENVISEDATKQDEAEYQMNDIMENFDEIMYEMENIIAESYEGRGFIESTCEEYPHNYLKCIADYNEKMEDIRSLYDTFASD